MNVFKEYSQYYNLLYRDKDYLTEANFIKQLLQLYAPNTSSILDLGCGTGKHDLFLALAGYQVTGVDLSKDMLEEANKKIEQLENKDNLQFSQGDLRNVRLNKQFDAIISLFHVMSYQTTNEDLKATFATVKEHLKPGGIFIFDFWYGPAVLSDLPSVRVKRLKDQDLTVTRISEPTLHPNINIVDINYQVFIQEESKNIFHEIQETHTMRYLFKPEIELLTTDAQFQLIECCEWLTRNEPGLNTWGVYCVIRA